ncbi:DUF6291 domain-containing protein [Chryseobacterium soli]|uniref:DUF6291 domain-containing protein n=1 Tax=Chryseobacterium soli TaxID=445961 RepID=UPI0029547BB8|nr:DUF6291 domain-containing protein [Chryseobacterium soli]MDV7696265.1 DUF6291 domain-containing protein [Chryseobacterium soli]
MKDKDNGVIFLKDWLLLIDSLSTENKLVFWDLFTAYEFGKEQICDNPFVAPTWNFIKKQLDNMREKYKENIIDRNRSNGSKGGRPPKETQKTNSEKTKPTQTEKKPENPVGYLETQKTPNENVNVNENENENEKENENNFLLEKETKDPVLNSEELFNIGDKLPEEKISKKVAKKKVLKSNDEVLIIPEEFITIWDEWKQYRKDRKIKAYAAIKWEQKAIDNLLELSNKDPGIAKEILNYSYRNSYQGFFPLKNTPKPPLSNNGEFETNR